MHEFSITSSIIDILKNTIKDRDIKKIKKVNFLINSYGGVEPRINQILLRIPDQR